MTAAPPETTADPRARYERRRDRFAAEASGLERRSRRMASLRGALFVAAAGCLVGGAATPKEPQPLLLAAAAILAGAFAAAVMAHHDVERRLRRARALRAINEEGLARLRRDWERIPPPPDPGVAEPPPEAEDLGLLGHASLLHLAGTVGTRRGSATLARWLLEPADAATVRRRQEAARELAPMVDLRQELALLGRLSGAGAADLGPLVAWSEGPAWLAPRPWWRAVSFALPVVTTGLIAASVAGWPGVPVWTIPAGAALVVTFALRRAVHAVFDQVSAGERALAALADALRAVAEARVTSPAMRELQDTLAASRVAAHRQLRALDRLGTLADLRLSGMVYLPVQVLTLWDLHVLAALERWQRRVGRHARRWEEALAEVEALCALAGLVHDHPTWCTPEIAGDAGGEAERLGAGGGRAPPVAVRARALGHPLLPPDRCVANDVTVGPPGTVLLVTGSNMSGKSTLLRAVGANAALALAGGPACARSLELPVVVLGSSFRVRDSLAEGVSTFMAELRRLRDVVRLAEETTAGGGPPLLYLFDEILMGTNVTERQIAVQRVLAHLLRLRAVGGIATHDLSLATAEGLAGACRPVHFREVFDRDARGRPRMTFDYRLHAGVAPTTNALHLLEMVGLDRGPER